MTNPDVLYVPDVARRLGRSEPAIRSALARGSSWLPPSFKMGRRVAWRRVDFDRFLAAQAKGGAQ
jgi:predicted DNA-binding transcriptional regulator AlpA